MLKVTPFQKRKEKLLKKSAEIIRVEEKDVARVIQRFQNELVEMEKHTSELKK